MNKNITRIDITSAFPGCQENSFNTKGPEAVTAAKIRNKCK